MGLNYVATARLGTSGRLSAVSFFPLSKAAHPTTSLERFPQREGIEIQLSS